MSPGRLLTSTLTGMATVVPGTAMKATVMVPGYVPDAALPNNAGRAQIGIELVPIIAVGFCALVGEVTLEGCPRP